ncbi:MAG: serine/threonine-protein kinase [Kofleriaceae bacterium]
MVRSTPTGLREGLRLGEFVIGERIGRGGFADVYRAIQPSLGREAVIKVLHSATARRVQLFEQEARLACLLDHPYAAHVYAFGVERDGLMWLAMELVRGISLADWLETKGPIPLKRFAVVFERLCEVVHTAHGAGLVHRDIKPANVMVVTRAGRLMPKLLDFGIATMVAPSLAPAAARPVVASDDSGLDDSTDPQHTNDEPASGTPAYMAPEQWHGHQDHRVDIYALGVLAYRCLTNRAPFAGKTPNELYRAHQQQVVPPLGGEFSPALDEVLGIALAKRPEERYGTALELSTALLTAMGNDPGWIARADAESYLTTAPPHIAACVAQLLAAASLAEACEATQVLIGALAQWLGIVALAAAASLHAYTDHPLVQRLHHESLTPREWLELASALCAPYADHDEDFPIPEMVRWFVDDDGERRPETLVAALAVTRGEMTAFPRDVLARVLRGLRFVCAYTLFLGDDEWSAIVRTSGEGPIWISDGDRNPLFELSPLVAAEPPAPGEAVALFAITGGGRSGAKQVSPPHGYERESGDVWPWIEARFHTGAADRERTIADRLPYRGLATFSAGDAELFFGRTRFVGQLFNRVLLHPFVALTGPSGSGKSSVVQAGLIPRMPDDWITVTMRPGRHPVAAFRTAVSQHLADAVDIVHWLRDARRRLLLVVDQAEELLTLASIDEGRELAAMLSQLVAVGGDRVRIVVTLRHDFIGRADELPEWRELIQHNLVLVTVPTGEELTQMIQGPAGQVGYEFDDPALVADMVAEVADRPGGLPLLSFAASRLWDARDPATQRMTREAYRAMGGVGGALAGYAEEVFATLSTSQQTITRDLMRHLITAAGTRAPARREDLASIAEHANVVVERLITARILVTSERVDGGENITLIHEALIERWPRLVKWRAEDAQGAHHRDELRGAATVWNMHDRDPSYLWRGEALAVYRTWAPRWAGSLTAIESAFGEAGIRATSRARRVRRIGVGAALSGLAAAALVLVVLFGRAESHRRDAEERFTELLADRGRSELVADRPLRALVYLSAAYSRGRDGAGMRVLLAQAARDGSRALARPGAFEPGESGDAPRLGIHVRGSRASAIVAIRRNQARDCRRLPSPRAVRFVRVRGLAVGEHDRGRRSRFAQGPRLGPRWHAPRHERRDRRCARCRHDPRRRRRSDRDAMDERDRAVGSQGTPDRGARHARSLQQATTDLARVLRKCEPPRGRLLDWHGRAVGPASAEEAVEPRSGRAARRCGRAGATRARHHACRRGDRVLRRR